MNRLTLAISALLLVSACSCRKQAQGAQSAAAEEASVEAPVRAGDLIGQINVLLDGEQIASVDAVAAETVEMPGMLDALLRILKGWRI